MLKPLLIFIYFGHQVFMKTSLKESFWRWIQYKSEHAVVLNEECLTSAFRKQAYQELSYSVWPARATWDYISKDYIRKKENVTIPYKNKNRICFWTAIWLWKLNCNYIILFHYVWLLRLSVPILKILVRLFCL